jgi:hypothetical protein
VRPDDYLVAMMVDGELCNRLGDVSDRYVVCMGDAALFQPPARRRQGREPLASVVFLQVVVAHEHARMARLDRYLHIEEVDLHVLSSGAALEHLVDRTQRRL